MNAANIANATIASTTASVIGRFETEPPSSADPRRVRTAKQG